MNSTKILWQSKSWSDFKANLQKLDSKRKGDCFEALTVCYLRLHPNYATKLKHVWRLCDVPPKVRRHLNLPGPDEGIDLVAETKEGEYWAIQCKYREDETKSLARKELSTFTDLALNICQNISLALICTTADRFSRKLKLYGERVSFVCGDKWRELDDDFFGRLHKLITGKTALPKPLKPRPHQQRAIKNAYKHFVGRNNSRGKLIMPCGTGKSLAAYWIAEGLEARFILIAVPSLHLIRQTLEVWARESMAKKKDIYWICVCSDVTVADIGKEDLAVLAQDLGVRIHTDPDEIAEWLRKRRQGFTVVITTYQSGRAVSEATNKAGRVFDVGIMDEAHKTVGKKDSLFSHLLYDGNIKIRKRIFMTATERRYVGKSDQIASMDDPELYGHTFELLSFKAALECEPPILSDYKIVTMAVARSEVAELIEENLFVKPDKGKWDEDVEAEMLATAVVLRKALLKRPIRHAVSFHSSIARAKAFKGTQDILTATFPEYKNLETFHVSGITPTSVRRREIDRFAEAPRSLITNARCLTEGVDVPNIDCVLFADPRKSTIDIVQGVGRALRPEPNKKLGYVIVPILLDDEVDWEQVLQTDAFDAVLTTLRALAANDDRIIDYFRSISQGRKPGRGSSLLETDIPLGFHIDTDAFVRSIELRFWSRLTRLIWRSFEEARQFVHELNLKNASEWRVYCLSKERPFDIPSNPNDTYKNKGWKNWGDWLGTDRIATHLIEFLPFTEARNLVHKLNLKSQKDWKSYCNSNEKPENIPLAPGHVYQDKGWKNWGDWLGTYTIAHKDKEFLSFEEARKFVRQLNLKSSIEWVEYCKSNEKPENIPSAPEHVYQNKGWKNWGDWLGTGWISNINRVFLSYEKAKEYVHPLNIRSISEWKKYCKSGNKPYDIPSNPNRTYKNKRWKGYGDWLGTGRVADQYKSNKLFISFEEAREFVHKLSLRSSSEWRKYCKIGTKPDYIPASPDRVYKNKRWKGYGDWLGTGRVADQHKSFLPFEDAREFVHKLNLKNGNEWKTYCKSGNKPDHIPSKPQRTYKNKGWKGMGDWLRKN